MQTLESQTIFLNSAALQGAPASRLAEIPKGNYLGVPRGCAIGWAPVIFLKKTEGAPTQEISRFFPAISRFFPGFPGSWIFWKKHKTRSKYWQNQIFYLNARGFGLNPNGYRTIIPQSTHIWRYCVGFKGQVKLSRLFPSPDPHASTNLVYRLPN